MQPQSLAAAAAERYPEKRSVVTAEIASNIMDPKPRPNHSRYLQILRSLTPEQRLLKAFELSDFSKSLFLAGLHRRFPNATEDEFREILFDRLDKCHNRNY